MTIVISLGGSIIVPVAVDTTFLLKFKKLILDFIRRKKEKVILVTGGGHTARFYIDAAAYFPGITDHDKDMVGIASTHLNAELVRILFGKDAYKEIIRNPTKKVTFNKVLLAGGWKPGCSTDMDAVILAQYYKAHTVINLSNIKYIYDQDPKKHPDARQIEKISWKDFSKIVGNKWSPGLNAPFDPIATQLASKLKLKVIIAKGTDLKNLKNILYKNKFVGSVIS